MNKSLMIAAAFAAIAAAAVDVKACEKKPAAEIEKPAATLQNDKPGFHSTGQIVCEGCSQFAKPGERFHLLAINPSAVW